MKLKNFSSRKTEEVTKETQPKPEGLDVLDGLKMVSKNSTNRTRQNSHNSASFHCANLIPANSSLHHMAGSSELPANVHKSPASLARSQEPRTKNQKGQKFQDVQEVPVLQRLLVTGPECTRRHWYQRCGSCVCPQQKDRQTDRLQHHQDHHRLGFD